MIEQKPIAWEALNYTQRDELVAERVLGWRKCTGPTLDKLWWKAPKGDREPQYFVPRYSSDLGDAWEIVDYFRDQIFSKRERFFNELYQMFRVPGGDHPTWPHAMAFLKPEHLCVAALRATGIEVDYVWRIN